MIVVKESLCEVCGVCIGVCPVDAINMGANSVTVDHSNCIDCGVCVRVCPVGALESAKEGKQPV